jgi:hypothetical protein
MTTVTLNPNITVNASAQYIIDNGTHFPFTVVAQSSMVQQYNLVAFQTGVLSPGSHHLFVEYGVDNFVNGSAPLVLGYFIVQNLTIPPFTPTPPNTTSTTRLSEGVVAGAVIALLAGLALIVFSLIRFIKGKKAAASLGRAYNLTTRKIMSMIREGM